MTTIYIKGQGKYKSKVKKSLAKSDLVEGDHYIEGVDSLHKSALYWITSRITLKQFKQGIGAKNIWKYRLRFYSTIEEMAPKQEPTEFTAEEKQLIEEYRYEL